MKAEPIVGARRPDADLAGPPAEAWLRRFLLGTAAVLFVMTPVELLLVEHTGDLVQVLPFAFCGVGLAAVGAALAAPGRRVLRGLRWAMVALVLGSAFGVYEHAEHNWAFEQEIRPEAAFGEVLWEALFGASPLLAPGILALGAVLALAATYRHPALYR